MFFGGTISRHGIALKHLETARKLAMEIGLDDEHPQVIEIKAQITSITEQTLTSSISKHEIDK
ncbi:unnamed protein product, partial [Rotaria sp. Silwood1]